MSLPLRILLIAASVLLNLFVLKKIRRAKLQIDDAIYWILFSLVPLALSIFPQIAVWASDLLGFLSPANFIFLCMIFLVLVKLFSVSIDLSVQKARFNRLVQEMALRTERDDAAKKIDVKRTPNAPAPTEATATTEATASAEATAVPTEVPAEDPVPAIKTLS